MKYHPAATVTENAINARNIVRGVLGSGCNYADGRKNGVRYKWLFYTMYDPYTTKRKVEDALYNANIKNWSLMLHINKHNQSDAISVTIYA
jgi:hypothetical protein